MKLKTLIAKKKMKIKQLKCKMMRMKPKLCIYIKSEIAPNDEKRNIEPGETKA